MRCESVGRAELFLGDSRDVLKILPDACIDSVVTDPPYALVSVVKRFGSPDAKPTRDGDVYSRASSGFMGKSWDTGETAFAVEFWAEVMRVLKPGGHVIAASGTRTYHRLAVAIEDAGFEIRDMVQWLYGSGFPKSHDVSKGIDKAAGAVRAKVRVDASDVRNPKATGAGRDGMDGATRPWIEEALARGYHEKDGDEPATPEAAKWQGWGTALKPACEPWVLARKPLIGTVAANVLEHGAGALNIDGCRVGDEVRVNMPGSTNERVAMGGGWREDAQPTIAIGRWPANVIHDGSDEIAEGLGEAMRFFYCPKASKADRGAGNKHPTVKPTDLMRYLCRLVTPPGGIVLDPFMGSGSTGKACAQEGFAFIGIERESEYFDISLNRLTGG